MGSILTRQPMVNPKTSDWSMGWEQRCRDPQPYQCYSKQWSSTAFNCLATVSWLMICNCNWPMKWPNDDWPMIWPK